MNKKFSTLVASLLLASSLGTAGAITPVYSMFTQAGETATSLKMNGAFQLAGEDGKVLAMINQNGKYVLKMVSNDGTTKLAETLWTVRWTTGEGNVKKYYFTFESAAYNMPLSFSTENAGKGSLTADINYEFPGKIGTWEWQEGIEGAGINGVAALKYRFANPDSVMALAVDVNSNVGAVKYAQAKENATLKLKPITVASTILTADDLNSIMLSNKKADKFRLSFNGDVLGSTVGNMWTANDLVAEPVFAHSTNMFKDADKGDWKYNLNQRTAAEASKAAADALVVPETVINAVKEAIKNGNDWDQVAKAWAAEVQNAAKAEVTFAAALEAVQKAIADKVLEVNEAAALSAAATDINTVVAAYKMEEIEGVANTKAVLGKVITDVDNTTLTTNEAAFEALFTGKVVMTDDVKDGYTSSVSDIKNLAEVFVPIPDGSVAENNDEIKGWIKKTYSDDAIQAVVLAVVGAKATVAEANIEIAKLTTAAAAIVAAVDLEENAFVAHEDAWDLPRFKTEYAKIAYVENQKYTEAQFLEVKEDILLKIDRLPIAIDAPALAQKAVEDEKNNYAAVSAAKALFTPGTEGITAAIDAMNSAKTVKDAILFIQKHYNDEGDAIIAAISNAVVGNTLVEAVNSVDISKYLAHEIINIVDEDKAAQYVSLYLRGEGAAKEYLAVDTNLLTGVSGNRHLKFGAWKYNENIKNSEGELLSVENVPLFRDYNGHFNFKFTYHPTQDSLVIITDGYAMKPAVGVDKWVDITDVDAAKAYPANGNTVKLVVLSDTHKEVTVGNPEIITGSTKETINTRIGFGINFRDYAAVPTGVYTIKYVSNDKNKANRNGRYITYNWLENDNQVMASIENQELNHIPAAQWIVTQAKGEKLNSIVNRESAKALVYTNEFGNVQQQYMYATATKGLYTNMDGDSLLFTAVPAEFTTDKTLGYFIDAENNKEADDQLKLFGLKYLNNLNDDLFVGFNDADSILNVAKTGAEDIVYFRLIRATDSLAYGAAEVKDIAKQLKRIPYYLQLETANKNIKDEDKLFITLDKDGKYKLINSTLTNGKVNYANLGAFFLKEFKDADTHYYALIEAARGANNAISGALGSVKISVKDYPSILVREDLEGENQTENWGYTVDGRTSTFALIEKAAPKYRRLGVTDAEDGLNNLGTNIAKINITREAGRYLYENTSNKVAGYESDPTGLDYLGAMYGADKAAMFIDTAYVRNETARPQYLLAVRPDFTPDTVFCPINHGHAYDLVDQVRANYMVTLVDSVAAYKGDKNMLDKFMFESRTYTRLAFVDAVHQGDSLVIMSSKYNGTNEAKKDTINLSKNAFNNAAVQFRLTKNDDQTAEFYIETLNNEYVRLINGVAVLTKDISDAERFNIAKTDDKPVANEGIETSKVTIIAGKGTVAIKGAEGKKVVINNVLGQTIVNTMITSSEATIAVSAGVVVVAVEGEAAVKAIVK